MKGEEMKSKVKAIKISIIAIIISSILYIGCQTDFYVCYIVLKSVAHVINVIKVNIMAQLSRQKFDIFIMN